jgi:sulfur carrier protein ThiS
MKVTVKLFATLAGHLPPAARRAGQVAVEVAPGSTVADLIAQLELPPVLCTLVLVDGRFVARTDHAARMLGEGETVAIWPPIGGG